MHASSIGGIMAGFSVFFYFFILFLLLFIAAAFKAFILKKENNLLAEQLTETTVSLTKTRQQLHEAEEKQKEIVDFHKSLGEVTFTQNLQNPAPKKMYLQEKPRNSPERYSYVHSLTNKGLSEEEIASILSISIHEAAQLIALARIAQGN